jgi:dihydrofolate reductase
MAQRDWIGKVYIATSLDGFISRPDGDIDWLSTESRGDHAPGDAGVAEDLGYAEHMADVDYVVMGRGTYEKVLTFDGWPYPDKRVIVLSTGLSSADERITVTRTVDETVALLDKREARGVYVDGGATIQAFLHAGLIDTIVLTRIPVLIGQGRPLFGPLPGDIQLVHEGTMATGHGLVQSRYRILHPRSQRHA